MSYLVIALGTLIWCLLGTATLFPFVDSCGKCTCSEGTLLDCSHLNPTLGAGVIGMMLLIQRWPWMSNTIVAITEENAEIQYRLVNRLLSIVSIEIGLIFLLVTWNIVNQTNGNPSITPLIVVITTMSWVPVLGWYFWASFRHA